MLKIKNLTVSFNDGRGGEAVHDLSLHMEPCDMLGVVGESGSGKTITALTVAGLIERGRTTATGEIIFLGQDLLHASRDELRKIQGNDIGVIFQEPMTSLNPLMRVGRQIGESLRIHTNLTKQQQYERILEVMRAVELPEPEVTYKKFPHQLSGGQRQRAMIAAAIIMHPKLLIADEPTTALDVTVQGQILKLLRRINEYYGVGILFISHDLSVVRKLCTRVAVMCDGKLVESGSSEEVFANPQQEYTKKLIAAIPNRSKRDA